MATLSVRSPIATAGVIAADIKIAHSVFALPFAVLAAFMAEPAPIDWASFSGKLVLVVLAMVFARTVAMLSNRLLDARIDRENPRTAARAIPSGRLSPATARGAMVCSVVAFLLVCVAFGALFDNWWPTWLGAPVLVWISVYPLLKRFTAWCHFYLGSSLALSPIAAALAVNPTACASQPSLWLLSGAVLFWVAGFDIIYALQDIDADRRQGLHSMPGRLGMTRGLWVARAAHGLAAGALIAAALVDDRFGLIMFGAVTAVVALLAFEHATVARWGTSRLALAFFTVNGVISCLLGAAGILDILV